MSDTRSDSLTTARARAAELVAGWLDGSSPVRPPSDILRVETLGAEEEIGLCFCAGTFCWPTNVPSCLPA
jgi:hypothetical protein